jgi:hypothetical protein
VALSRAAGRRTIICCMYAFFLGTTIPPCKKLGLIKHGKYGEVKYGEEKRGFHIRFHANYLRAIALYLESRGPL